MLEREQELAELSAAVREAAGGMGSIVLINGEAGIGKTNLAGSLSSMLPPDGRLLVGYCDDLATRRVFGPLRDLAGEVGAALAEALESADRTRVIELLQAELAGAGPTVLVVEDLHWVDEATLDVLRFLARRVSTMPAVLVLTYRDDELTRDHPLRHLLGVVARTERVRRLALPPLSPDAVRRLGDGHDIDVDRLYALTAGNPFFVVEVLAAHDHEKVPATVSEAVQARLHSLDVSARDALELLSVIPSSVERWLAETIVPGGLPALASAERSGVLVLEADRVAFRHELTRRSIVDSMPVTRRVACHRTVLRAMLDAGRSVDVSRVVHHAAEAGDDDIIVKYGWAAAHEAASAGSHTEAVAHYRRLVERRAAFTPADQAELLEGYAVECYTVGLADLAVAAQQDAVRLRRELRDPVALGLALRWLSRMHWWAVDRPAAEAAAAEATVILTDAGDARALALALSNESHLHMLSGRLEESITIGRRAARMARELDDAAILSHALTNIGGSLWYVYQSDARTVLAEALEVALAAGEGEHACRVWTALVWLLIDSGQIAEAETVLRDALEFADEGEFLGYLRHFRVCESVISLARGHLHQAERQAELALDAQTITRGEALVVQGRARVRRGLPGGREILDEAWQIARRLGEAQRLAPAASALLEAAWLDGDAAAAVTAVLPWYEEVRRHGLKGDRAELGHWLRRVGTPVGAEFSGHPYALLAHGQWREAAEVWQRAGYPYEHALALTESDDPADLLIALRTLDGLGAEPLGRRVRERLRALGVSRVPRGPMSSTRQNAAQLTGRQLEVVGLLAEGLTNAEIAARLVLSVRTVDAHVAAVLGKLHARTRHDAVREARRLGLLDDR